MNRKIHAHETYEVSKFQPKRIRDMTGEVRLGLEVHARSMIMDQEDVFYLAFTEKVWQDLSDQINKIIAEG